MIDMVHLRRLVVPVVVGALIMVGCGDDDGASVAGEPSVPTPSPESPADQQASAPTKGSGVAVTIRGLAGYAGGELAGVLHQEPDGRVVGGFSVDIDNDDFTTTQAMQRPGDSNELPAAWPHLGDEVLVVTPGRYTLALWADTGLGAYTEWLPLNTDGNGLAGCVFSFEVGEQPQIEVVLSGDLWTTGYSGVCREATTMPERQLTLSEDRWVEETEGIELTLTPERVDPTTGAVQVSVTGLTTPGYAAVWVIACPGLQGRVEPQPFMTDVANMCAPRHPDADLRSEGAVVNADVENGSFSTSITVPIDSEAIADGGVVILAGDILTPIGGTALLRVG